MKQIKQVLTRYKSQYAAAKANKVTATQLDRLIGVGALVDDEGQVWIKSKTVLIDCVVKEIDCTEQQHPSSDDK